jgi:hypothetical protein
MRELRRHQSNFPASDHTPLTAKVSSTETKIRKEIAIMKKCRHANIVMLLEIIDDPISERIFMGARLLLFPNLSVPANGCSLSHGISRRRRTEMEDPR